MLVYPHNPNRCQSTLAAWDNVARVGRRRYRSYRGGRSPSPNGTKSMAALYQGGTEPRRGLLFLRAFDDDQVQLPPPQMTWLGRLLEIGQRRQSLDALLLEEGTQYGPVVALGNPNDPIPPYGAARGYFQQEDWQKGVSALASDSQIIVMCLEGSAGIWWEVDNIVAELHFAKTLFLLRPKYMQKHSNAQFLEKIGTRIPRLVKSLTNTADGTTGSVRSVLGFFQDADGQLRLVHSSTFSRFAYLLTLRWFLRSTLSGLMPRASTDLSKSA
jgi:hypothetical protein